MFPLLSLPASVASRFRRFPLKFARLSLMLALLVLISAAAHAQGLPPGWSASPCDVNGNILSTAPVDANGFYIMTGMVNRSSSNTYPKPMIAAQLSGTPLAQQYWWTFNPFAFSPTTFPVTIQNGISTGSNWSSNFAEPGGTVFTYSVPAIYGTPNTGNINGSVTVDASGQLLYYFKVQWTGGGAAPPPPPSLNLLLSTYVWVTASASPQNSGTSASVTASDGAPYYEGASLSAGGSTAFPPPVTVTGHHLVQAAINSSTGIAEAYLNGTAHSQTSNPVPPSGGAASAGAGANITCGVRPDNRSVLITSSLGQTSHKSTIHFDNNGIALPDPDTPGADGTTVSNTVKPDPAVDELITYFANPSGTWAANSAYVWHVNVGRPYVSSDHGTFTMPNDPPIGYSALYSLASTATGGGHEHVTVHVTDAVDGADVLNNYYLMWHDPGENWHNIGPNMETAPELFGTSSSHQPANGFANVSVAPDEVDWSLGAHIGGGLVTTGAAVLVAFQPETSPLVIGFLTAFGYTLSLAPPPAPTLYTPQGTEAQFTADVKTENKILGGNTSGVFLPGSPRMTTAYAAAIALSGNYHGYFTGAMGHSFYFTVQIYRHRFSQNHVGDGYGSQGYYGAVYGTLTNSGSLEYVYNWT